MITYSIILYLVASLYLAKNQEVMSFLNWKEMECKFQLFVI